MGLLVLYPPQSGVEDCNRHFRQLKYLAEWNSHLERPVIQAIYQMISQCLGKLKLVLKDLLVLGGKNEY